MVWSLRRGGEVVERRYVREERIGHMRTVAAPGCGQQWRLSPTELESRRRGKEADHVEREGARAEPWTVERRATHDGEGREADDVET